MNNFFCSYYYLVKYNNPFKFYTFVFEIKNHFYKESSMRKSRILLIAFIIISFFTQIKLQAQDKSFKCIVLGNSGGNEGNMSAYMLSTIKSDNYICIDAGTLQNGISKALKEKSFGKFKLPKTEKRNAEIYILQNFIKGYLISHAHIDHIAALISNAPIDSRKYIYATQYTMENLSNHIFNNRIAANWGNEGTKEPLKKYKFITLPQNHEIELNETEMSVKTYYTSHGNEYISSAFLIKAGNNHFLYFGDCGSDEIERNNYMNEIWNSVAELIKEKKLNAIMIECSYPDEQPDNMLYGHLKPSLLTKELNQLARRINEKEPEKALKGLKIIISHVKSNGEKNDNSLNTIKYQLEKANNLDVKYIFPEQGEKIEF